MFSDPYTRLLPETAFKNADLIVSLIWLNCYKVQSLKNKHPSILHTTEIPPFSTIRKYNSSSFTFPNCNGEGQRRNFWKARGPSSRGTSPLNPAQRLLPLLAERQGAGRVPRWQTKAACFLWREELYEKESTEARGWYKHKEVNRRRSGELLGLK